MVRYFSSIENEADFYVYVHFYITSNYFTKRSSSWKSVPSYEKDR